MKNEITKKAIREAFPYLNSINQYLILTLINDKVESEVLEKFESNAKWIKQCYNRPSNWALKLNALNELLKGFGTEPITTENSIDSYWRNCRAVYINMGDSYNATIIYDTVEKCFLITTFADFIESLETIEENNY